MEYNHIDKTSIKIIRKKKQTMRTIDIRITQVIVLNSRRQLANVGKQNNFILEKNAFKPDNKGTYLHGYITQVSIIYILLHEISKTLLRCIIAATTSPNEEDYTTNRRGKHTIKSKTKQSK